MDKVVDRVVFITHPVWPATVPRYVNKTNAGRTGGPGGKYFVPASGEEQNLQKRTPHEMKTFIYGELFPILRRIKGNPMFVLVPTPPLIGEWDYELLDTVAKKSGYAGLEGVPAEKKGAFFRHVRKEASQILRLGQRNHRKALTLERKFYHDLQAAFPNTVTTATGKYGTDSKQVAKEIWEQAHNNGIRIAENAQVIGFGAWQEACASHFAHAFKKSKMRVTVPKKGTISLNVDIRRPKRMHHI